MTTGETGKERSSPPTGEEPLISITNRANLSIAAQVGEAVIGQLDPYVGGRRISRIDVSLQIHLDGEDLSDPSDRGKIISIAHHATPHHESSPRLAIVKRLPDGCCETGDYWGGRISGDNIVRPQSEFSIQEEVAAYSLAMPRPKDNNWFAHSSLLSVAVKVLGQAVQPIWVNESVKQGPLSQDTQKHYPSLSEYVQGTRRLTIKNALEVSDSLRARNAKMRELQQTVVDKYRSFIESGDGSLSHLGQFDTWLKGVYPDFNSGQLIRVLQRVEPYQIRNPLAINNFDRSAGWAPEVMYKERLPDVDAMAVLAVKTRFVLDELREDYKYKTDLERAVALKSGEIDGVDPDEFGNQKVTVLARKLHEADKKLEEPLAKGLQDPAIASVKLSECLNAMNADPFFAQFDGITKLMILNGSVSVDQLRIIATQIPPS